MLKRVNKKLVLPAAYLETGLQGLHNDIGHLGKESTLMLIRNRFYFQGMGKAVDAWINSSNRCLRRKSSTNNRAPLVSMKPSQTFRVNMYVMVFNFGDF